MTKSIYSDEQQILIHRIKLARQEAGLSQRDAVKLLNKTQSFISKIESGQRRIDIVQLKALARIYKKEINTLIK
jgi:transcriptional regulator with XRE-family HTH domain